MSANQKIQVDLPLAANSLEVVCSILLFRKYNLQKIKGKEDASDKHQISTTPDSNGPQVPLTANSLEVHITVPNNALEAFIWELQSVEKSFHSLEVHTVGKKNHS